MCLLILNCYKASETLLGIETKEKATRHAIARSYKASETLLGIETQPKFSGGITPAWLQSL